MPSVAARAGPSSRRDDDADVDSQAGRRGDKAGTSSRRRAARDEDDEEEDEEQADGDDVQVVGGNVANGDVPEEALEKQTRDTRMEYREMLKTVQGAQTGTGEFGAAELKKLLEQSGELFHGVRGPQEGILDSRLLIQAGALGSQLATDMKIESGFEVEEFMERAIRLMGGRLRAVNATVNNDDDDDVMHNADDWDWDKLGRQAAALSSRPMTMDHLLGPLASKPKARNATRVETVDRSGNRTQPQQLESGAIGNANPETSALVQKISKRLEEVGGVDGINLFRFVVNPHSFSNTVENMFYVSFLIREGSASIEDNDEGEPILLRCEEPTDEDYNQGVTRRQIIMELDMSVWKNLIEEYGIEDTIIPTRTGANQVTDTWQPTQV